MKPTIIVALTMAVAVNVFAQDSPWVAATNLAKALPHHVGTIRYPSGEVAAGVHVTFYPGTHYSDDDYNYHEAITDNNGHYDIFPPKKTSSFHVGPILTANVIMARDLEKNFAAVQSFPVVTTNVDLALQAAITLTGSVKNTEGEPVSGADIDLGFRTEPYSPQMRPSFQADKQGNFSIPALPQGVRYHISGIMAKGYGSGHAHVEAGGTWTNHYEFPTFVLKHADRILGGRVVRSDGKPVANAEVSFRGDGQPENSKTKTDSEGKFFTDTLCEGEIHVSTVFWGPPLMSDGGGAGMKVQAGDTNVIIQIRNPNQ